MLEWINSKLSILELLQTDIKELKASLDFSQSQIDTLMLENNELKGTVKNLSAQVTTLTQENKDTKETILDLQCRSIHDNLIFSGIAIPQNTHDPEKAVKDFMLKSLQLPVTTVKDITFHRVHRLSCKDHNKPLPIIAKFEHHKHKEIIKSRGMQLKGTNFGMNDQSPEEFRTDAEPFCQS